MGAHYSQTTQEQDPTLLCEVPLVKMAIEEEEDDDQLR